LLSIQTAEFGKLRDKRPSNDGADARNGSLSAINHSQFGIAGDESSHPRFDLRDVPIEHRDQALNVARASTSTVRCTHLPLAFSAQ
jgi:hypothetical protein